MKVKLTWEKIPETDSDFERITKGRNYHRLVRLRTGQQPLGYLCFITVGEEPPVWYFFQMDGLFKEPRSLEGKLFLADGENPTDLDVAKKLVEAAFSDVFGHFEFE